jgi:hypothetical protein
MERVVGGRIPLADAARMIGTHPDSLRRGIKAGIIPATKSFGIWTLALAAVQMFRANYGHGPDANSRGMLL